MAALHTSGTVSQSDLLISLADELNYEDPRSRLAMLPKREKKKNENNPSSIPSHPMAATDPIKTIRGAGTNQQSLAIIGPRRPDTPARDPQDAPLA